MSSCQDKRYEKMLYALELGILSEAEREELEVHLIECDACFEKASRFEEAVRHLRFDPDVRREVEAMAPGTTPPATSWNRRMLKWLPAVAALLVLTMLVAGPWRPGAGPGDETVAGSNRIAVMYFEDLSGSNRDDRLGEIIANLLITDLGESRYVQVVSAQRLHDTRKLLGLSPDQIISADDATAVARRSGASWILTGSVIRREPLLVTSQIADVESGEVFATQRIEGDEGDNVFSLVDQLTIQIKNDLALPSEALQEPDRHVADYTTSSKEAYRYYLQGLDYVEGVYDRQAREAFWKAIETDSTFAMAYYYLSLLGHPELISKAIRYIDNTSTPDRYRIRSHEAMVFHDTSAAIHYLRTAVKRYPDEKDLLIQLGVLLGYTRHYDAAFEVFDRALEVDPLSKGALNRLTYIALMAERYDLAEQTVNRYIEIEPNGANPYDTRGDVLSAQNRLSEANDSYRQAIANNPDFLPSLLHLVRNLIIIGDFDQAEDALAKLESSDDRGMVSQGHLYRACLSIRKGKLTEAVDYLQSGQAFDMDNRLEFNLSFKRFLLSQLLSAIGSQYEAIKTLQSCPLSIDSVQPDPVVAYRHITAQYAARAGDFGRAEQFVRDLAASPSPSSRFGELYARGAVALYRGNHDESVSLLSQADSIFSSSPVRHLLARAFLEAGDYRRAVDLYQELMSTTAYRQALWTVRDIEAIYYSGLAYEGAGDYERAISSYEKFLALWGDASPAVPEADDARRRLERLRSQP